MTMNNNNKTPILKLKRIPKEKFQIFMTKLEKFKLQKEAEEKKKKKPKESQPQRQSSQQQAIKASGGGRGRGRGRPKVKKAKAKKRKGRSYPQSGKTIKTMEIIEALYKHIEIDFSSPATFPTSPSTSNSASASASSSATLGGGNDLGYEIIVIENSDNKIIPQPQQQPQPPLKIDNDEISIIREIIVID